MPARHHIDNKNRLIITTWQGDATDGDFTNALKAYLENIQSRHEYRDYNEIVDLREMSRIRLSIKGLVNIGKLASSTDQHRTRTKLAFIVSSELAFNFAKLYATYRNFGKKHKKQMHVFKNERNAVFWARANRQ